MTPDFLERLDVPRALALLGAGSEHPMRIGRFDVERRLGSGASGVVYLATDRALGRQVALKVLARPLARDLSAVERFAAEARFAGALEHPRIVPVHEIARDGDDVFIVMAYREGVTLRERLRAGALPVAEAMRVAAEVAEALAAAHAAGIVHRDIKPENILITARGACLLDFGIAKMVGQTLTLTGVAIGTPAYMSPEQTRGTPVDARTDLWSLGVVLHEMLAGERPFPGDSGDSVVYGVRNDPPAPLPRTVPRHVRRVVARCLAKAPSARPTAAEVIAALDAPDAPRRPSPTALVLGLLLPTLAGATWLAVGRGPAPRTPPSGSQLAILPLRVDSGALPPGYLHKQLYVELRDAFGIVPGLRVTYPASVIVAAREDPDRASMARRLDVGTFVDGTLALRGDSLLLSLVVTDASGERRWSGTLARPTDRIEGLQREARDSVLVALGRTPPPPPLRRPDPVAYDLLLQARFAGQESNDFTRRAAIAFLEEAIARDSAFAQACATLGSMLLSAGPQDGARARALFERAVALDSTTAMAWDQLGQIVAWEDHDWQRAEVMLRRAIALDSSDPGHYVALGVTLLAAGREEEALATVLRAREVDPLSSLTLTSIGTVLLQTGRYDAAVGALRQAIAVNPTTGKSQLLGRALVAAGWTDEGIGLLRQTASFWAGFEQRAALAYALGRTGRTSEARAIATQYESRAGSHATDLALIYVGLGDTARALDRLARAPEERGLKFYFTDRFWDPIRASPRFADVVRRYGITPP